MSADHRDRAELARIAAENGAARDADHLESSGGLTAVLAKNAAPSGRLLDATPVPTVADVGAIENGEVDERAATGGDANQLTPSSTATGSDERSEPDRFDDPIRMYLREIGRVELLSRDGEIALAKRIEAGRGKMVGALFECPLTMRAIGRWRDELANDRLVLRHIIDLNAPSYCDPGSSSEDGAISRIGDAEEGDDDNLEAGWPPLHAEREAALKPFLIGIFKDIARTYEKLHRLQEYRLELLVGGDDLTSSQEKRYNKLRRELAQLTANIHLKNDRIGRLVEEIYAFNGRLVGLEGRLLRLAVTSGVARESFLNQYRGGELNRRWLGRVRRLSGAGWRDFVETHRSCPAAWCTLWRVPPPRRPWRSKSLAKPKPVIHSGRPSRFPDHRVGLTKKNVDLSHTSDDIDGGDPAAFWKRVHDADRGCCREDPAFTAQRLMARKSIPAPATANARWSASTIATAIAAGLGDPRRDRRAEDPQAEEGILLPRLPGAPLGWPRRR